MGFRIALFVGVFVVLLLGARYVMSRQSRKEP